MVDQLISLAYLASAVFFIMGLKGLGRPRTAVRGNMLCAIGMLVAIVVTLLDARVIGFGTIIAGIAVGGLIGLVLAIKIEMTAMPQLVAMFNALGGGASVLVAGSELISADPEAGASLYALAWAVSATGIIGSVTFWGSMVAFGKLQGLVSDRAGRIPGRNIINIILGLTCLGLAAWLGANPTAIWAYGALALVSAILGLTMVLPIGGADMPVVIALLNSLSGLACSTAGFVFNNNGLIIAGSLVGASGLILTRIMCKAMNRSLGSVLFGKMKASADDGPTADAIYEGKIKTAGAEEIAMILETCRRVVIVPGYGMAVAQAQHAVRTLSDLLESRGIEVEFGIHPVAGRMPGHMNVLLAEAEINYEKIRSMDDINPTFEQTDLVMVIGANDVVNPMAREDPACAIGGMPILDVDKARTVVVIKRSLSAGFAGLPNPLFAMDNTLMFFSDGKQAVVELVEALKEGE